ncbi:MAG: type III PLP-dependent enzyme [Gammaproteobacteria bacterium]|nr:type III PLP-dependent enzyme [Gammaproteobacteria bacterium]
MGASPLSAHERSQLLIAAAAKATPAYVYLADDIAARAQHIRNVFGDRFALSYAVKANPNPGLLRHLSSIVELLDVSSGGELVRSLDCGFDATRLTFSGPAKTDAELLTAVERDCGQVIGESVDELTVLNRLCAERGKRMRISLRISPSDVPKGFGINMGGRPSQFGVDQEDLPAALPEILKMDSLDLIGLHIYAGTQCLDEESLAANLTNCVQVFEDATRRYELKLDELIFGAGFGIPYHPGDKAVDLSAVGERVNPVVDELLADPLFSRTRCSLELGRYLVGEAGYYLSPVIRTKHSRGKMIAMLGGGLNHHAAACGSFGSIIPRNYCFERLDVPPRNSQSEPVSYQLFGPLCTTVDQIGRDVELPRLDAGDVLSVASSGAYGPTASPVHFISHAPPAEYLAELVDGRAVLHDISHLG